MFNELGSDNEENEELVPKSAAVQDLVPDVGEFKALR